MDPVGPLLLVLACLLLSAFFSGSETALLRLRDSEIESDVRAARGPSALAMRDLLSSTSRLLVTILLGNNVVNILAAAVASALAVRYLGERSGILLATALMTLIVFIFCEVLPKALAANHPLGISRTVALPLYLIHQLLRPLHIVFDRFVDPFVRWAAGGKERELQTSAEEILRLARRARAGAAGTPLAIISAAAEAADMTVSEIMVPRTEIVSFPIDTPPADLLEHVLQERYTRVVVYEEDIDHVLGTIHLKDLIKLVREGEGAGGLHDILKPVLRVPERKPILRLLAEMQRAFVHVAVVKDEFEVTEGMVTQEDILEEIVGEIRDEFDREELLTIRRLPDGSYNALGRVKVLDFNRETGWEVPAHSGDSLSGVVFNALGRTPQRGDTVDLGDYRLQIVDLSGSRITQVKVSRRSRPKLEPVA